MIEICACRSRKLYKCRIFQQYVVEVVAKSAAVAGSINDHLVN